jgi:deoxyguanosine kinase
MRNRSYEQDLPETYLQRIQEAYFRFFRHQPDLPIVLVALGDADFLENPEVYAWIQSLLDQSWAPGLWRVER